ncbi:MAG: hypothetical protein JNL74_08200 [Fibrobacteres bacterium]|nr:hypothetical protein [Fibrobacterota bacterium]
MDKKKKTAVKTEPVKEQKEFNLSVKAALGILASLFVVFYFHLLTGSAYLWEDVIEQHYPNLIYTMSALKDGAFPQWNPYVFGGMPYMADMQTVLFYPPSWILFAIESMGEPGGSAYMVYIVLHVLLFGIGIFFLTKSFGVSKWASLFAATGAAFSGFVSTHIIHLTFLYVAAWFPLTLYFLKKALDESSLKDLGLASLFGGISILGGYAQYTLFCSYVFFLYAVYTLYVNVKLNKKPFIKTAIHLSIFFGIFVALSYGMALVQLFPSMELANESVRTKMTWERSIEASLPLSGLFSFLAPKFFGFVTGSGEGSPFWAGKGMHLFWETACFIGIIPLIFIATAFKELKKNPLFIFLLILSGLALLLMLGGNGPLYKAVFNFLPGFGSFRHPSRFAFVFLIAILPAAAMAMDVILTSGKCSDDSNRKNIFKRALIITSVVAALIIFIGLSLTPVRPEEASTSKNAMLIALLFAGLSLGSIRLILSNPFSFLAPVSAIAILFIELYLFGSAFGPAKNTGKDAYPDTPQLTALSSEAAAKPFRFQGRIFEGEGKGVRLFPHLNLGMVYKIATVEGYNQLHLGRLSRFVHEVEPQKAMAMMNVRFRARTDGRGFEVAPENAYRPRFALYRDVRSVGDSVNSMKAITNPLFNPFMSAVVEEPLTLLYAPADCNVVDKIRLISYKPERIELEVAAGTNALLVASESWFPAWHAELDGKEVPILKADFLFRGVEIPSGNHKLTFTYRSEAFSKGSKASLAALIVTIALIAVGTIRRKKLLHISD